MVPILKLFHTIRFLRPIQIYSRLKKIIFTPSAIYSYKPDIRPIADAWVTPVRRSVSLLGKWNFLFLNEEHDLALDDNWDNESVSKLWRYNLHYFDDLNASCAKDRLYLHEQLIEKWICDNPPATGTAWEPYPTSLRIVNWIKWVLAGNKPTKNYKKSLATQINWLSRNLEYHILGNHLFANAKALIFGGVFFNGADAQAWLEEGLQILENEIDEQILDDGGHFELSPMYHSIILEDILDVINLLNSYSETVTVQRMSHLHNISIKMLHWQKVMEHPDGDISFFNDATKGISEKSSELQKYASRLNINFKYLPKHIEYLKNSGYINLQNKNALGILDVAKIGPDYLPGHAHADSLSFELSLYQQRLFVNSGISEYGTTALRHKQRSTFMHNTVCIDDENSSEVWSGFRVARRAYPGDVKINSNSESTKITCSHNGYTRLKGKPTHFREWILKESSLNVIDRINGTFRKAEANFYIHPLIKINQVASDTYNLVMPSGQVVTFYVSGADSTSILPSFWYSGFGIKEKNHRISVKFSDTEINTVIHW